MRFSVMLLSIIAVFYGLSSSPAQAHKGSSFGPEISAEDFQQHVYSLSTFKALKQQQAYLQLQFKRLGLNSSALSCQTSMHGQMATLLGTEPSRTDSVVFFAAVNDIYQMASVLEIAERFVTTKPRPEHAVMFVFSDSSQEALTQCEPLKQTRFIIQPNGIHKLDSSSLVRELNILQQQGK
jgi:hypothetical protein